MSVFHSLTRGTRHAGVSLMRMLLIAMVTAGCLFGQIRVLGVAVSSDFTQDLPAMGSLASIAVTGLTGIVGVIPAVGFPLPYSLAGISVTVGGVPAPILAVADVGSMHGTNLQQINVQVPQWSGSVNAVV